MPAPEIPPVRVIDDQLYNVPAGIIPSVIFAGVTTKDTPLQVTVEIALIAAIGFTLTVTVNGTPLPQLTVDGVIV